MAMFEDFTVWLKEVPCGGDAISQLLVREEGEGPVSVFVGVLAEFFDALDGDIDVSIARCVPAHDISVVAYCESKFASREVGFGDLEFLSRLEVDL